MLVFPTLDGLAWDRLKTPQWKTQIKQSVSGYETRSALMAYPIWQFKLTFNLLRQDTFYDELKTLLGFYLQNKGAFDTWLYLDPTDYQVTNQVIAVGDGSSKSFQLIRNVGGFVDIVQAPKTITLMIDKTPTTAYTEQNGVITFDNAPSAGAEISWTGEFYYPCRFLDDTMEFNQFMYQVWEAKTVKFQSVKL